MAGLNLPEQHEVASMIEQIHQRGVGVLLVEHSLAIVQRLGQHVLCMDSGRKIAEGTAAEVMRSDAVQVAYMGVSNVYVTGRSGATRGIWSVFGAARHGFP